MQINNKKDIALIACPVETPLGIFTAVYEGGLVKRVLFPDENMSADIADINAALPFATQIAEYFQGKRKGFSLPLFIPGTRFMRDVYNATMLIPYGQTATYSDLALAAGYPRAARAVGSAMRANPLPVLIPCHRVVHKSKKLSSYTGGTDVKCFLLSMESKYK